MQRKISFHVPSPDETEILARRLGDSLRRGDCLLLSGPIGAGKSHFARALIQSRLRQPEEIPSPTFTLVQIYELDFSELWHCDLYRLSDPLEVIELGLLEAFDDAICLIEWPDRLQDLSPPTALHLEIVADPKSILARTIILTWQAPSWDKRMSTL